MTSWLDQEILPKFLHGCDDDDDGDDDDDDDDYDDDDDDDDAPRFSFYCAKYDDCDQILLSPVWIRLCESDLSEPILHNHGMATVIMLLFHLWIFVFK